MADKVDIWMPLSIGDYLADTSHLNTTQHGAYLLMLMHYWRKGPLPNNPETLANITKLSIDAWSIHQAVLMEFYIIGDDGLLHQKRADKEREEALVKKGKSTERAKSAAAARWSNAPSNASGMLEECPLPLPLPNTKKQKHSPKEKPSVDVRHTEFKKSFDGYYRRLNSAPAPWDGQEGKSLSNWLIANPTITGEQWNRILNNRRRSPVAQGKRLSMWINLAICWLGGIADEWGKEIKNNGSSRITSQSKQAATVEAGRAVIANLLGMDRDGVNEDWGPDGGAGEPGEDFIDGERVGGYSRVVT